LEQDLVHHLGKRLGRPTWDQTTIFNEVILKRQLYGLNNAWDRVQRGQGAMLDDGRKAGLPPPLRSPECDSTLKRILRGQVLSAHPDLMISVYHMDLQPIIALSEELGSLPLLHLATDLEIKMWEVFGRVPPAYPKFAVGVPFDVLASWESVAPLAPSQAFLSGYPVRQEFLKPLPCDVERLELRKHFGLVDGESLVLVMTGGGGQDVPWPRLLAGSQSWGSQPLTGVAEDGLPDGPLRVVIIAGKNASIAEGLSRALTMGSDGLLRGTNPLVTVQVAQDPEAEPSQAYFVGPKFLASLMDIASVAITKPGGGTTAELAYRGLPAVLDASKGAMLWEEFTIRRFEEAGCGVALRSGSSGALEAALRQSFKLDRCRKLAYGGDDGMLDPRLRIRRRASELCNLAFE